jgi:hypothetical protein
MPDESTQMMVQRHTASFAYTYYYFTPPAGRVLHDGWRSV